MLRDETNAEAAIGSDILRAADAALRLIPPAFPLEATVAVNPFLGHVEDDLPQAAARLARIAGARVTRPRRDFLAAIATGAIKDDDLDAALRASSAPGKPASIAALKASLALPAPVRNPLPTIAQLAAERTGTDWPALIARTVGLWAAGHFDRGHALWTPAPGQDAYSAWRDWATNDLTPEIAGLSGFCRLVSRSPDRAQKALLVASNSLGLDSRAAASVYHRLLVDLGGWAQHARWLMWTAEQEGRSDTTLYDLLTIRLIWESALLDHLPDLLPVWLETVDAHRQPLEPDAEQIVDAIAQEAAERAFQRQFAHQLAAPSQRQRRPLLQAAFCIDVRSEPYRRALESVAPGIETIGFAGFFGLPVAHRAHCSDEDEHHLPVLLRPQLHAASHLPADKEQAARIGGRATRAWGRFRQAAVSSFAFVEAAGLAYGSKLLSSALAKSHRHEDVTPRLIDHLSATEKGQLATKVLTAMGLKTGLAPIVVLAGHGATTTNNPHDSAYQCGACGGHDGAVSARLVAQLLNDPETRAALAETPLALPNDTVFVAALHDTTTDAVTLFADELPASEAARKVTDWFSAATARARIARASRLPEATPQNLAARAHDWAQMRPEWGLAGCAAFVAAPRSVTASANLDGRSFLHDYDWSTDDSFQTLELILTAPVVVASWIGLHYYGATLAPNLFGSGNKLIHNVVGGIGVLEGNGGALRVGLPLQALHDGTRRVHEPLRLSVFIEAPEAAIADILARHPDVRLLFDRGWLHLLVLDKGKLRSRYRPGFHWEAVTA